MTFTRQSREPLAQRFQTRFDHLGHGNIIEFLDGYLTQYNETKGRGLICLITGNHDVNQRLSACRDTKDLELCYLFLLTMPGAPFIFYGDGIGMRSIKGLVSKEGGITRTGTRTPMQWGPGPKAGFSSADLEQFYLPVDTAPDRPDVSTQLSDPPSLLNRVRTLIALRHAHPALQSSGAFEVVYAEAGKLPFVYKREVDGEAILAALNSCERPCEVMLEALSAQCFEVLYGQPDALARKDERRRLRLEGVSRGVFQTQL